MNIETFYYSRLRQWVFAAVGIVAIVCGVINLVFFWVALTHGGSNLYTVPPTSSINYVFLGVSIIGIAWQQKKFAFYFILASMLIALCLIIIYPIIHSFTNYNVIAHVLIPKKLGAFVPNAMTAGFMFLLLNIALLCNTPARIKPSHLWCAGACACGALGLGLYFASFNLTDVKFFHFFVAHLSTTTAILTALIAAALLFYSGSRFVYLFQSTFTIWLPLYVTIAALLVTLTFVSTIYELIIGLIFSAIFFFALYMAQIAFSEKLKAEKANKEKTMFLANMSHEIRTPLHGIIGSCSLLELSTLDEYQKKWVSGINKSGKMLLELLDDLLDMSKIEANAITIELHSIHIKELVEEVITLMTPQAHAKKLDLQFAFSPTLSDQFVIDGKRIRQILVNLISNAIKFTDKGFVRVSVAQNYSDNNSFLVFKVEDSGVGIPKERLKNIFKTYLNVDIRTAKGSGLGLAITKRLVHLMEGTIEAESIEGKGSVFTVKIPMKGESDG